MKLKSLCIGAVLLCAAQGAVADNNELESLKKNMKELQSMMQALQTKIDGLENGKTVQPAPAAAVMKGTSYLPEVGVIADIVGTLSQNDEDAEGNDRFSAREVELILGHDVDPYARLDATIAFSDFEEASLEEAYASYWDLPFESKLRIGKFKPKFGKAASVHRDSLDTVDEPLAVRRYFGAEGATHNGFDVTGFSPLSGGAFTQQITLGLLDGGNGEEARLVVDSQRRPLLYGRAAHSLDFSDSTSSALGFTWINGSADEDNAREVNLVGIDWSLDRHLSPYRKLKLLAEAYIADGATDAEPIDGLIYSAKSAPWGYYGLVDYRLNERWGFGVRWDWVQPVSFEEEPAHLDESEISPYITFYQSEFARWRLQYQHASLTDDTSDNRFYLQGTFAIGTHKHSLQ